MKHSRHSIVVSAIESVFDALVNTYYEDTYFSIFNMCAKYYYDALIFTDEAKRENRSRELINSMHDLTSYEINAKVFMLLCDVFNQINVALQVDIIVDFNNYDDIDTATYFFVTRKYERSHRNVIAFYDFQYCLINIESYTEQYMIDKQVYITVF